MKAKATALMLADLGVTKSHGRPYTSNDNRSRFKPLAYQPPFPKRLGCIEDAKTFCRSSFDWYNKDHHRAGIGLMTPDQVHYGQAGKVSPKAARTAAQTNHRLNHPANPKATNPSLNSNTGCLKVVDTFGIPNQRIGIG
jgi:putative transposase